MRYELSQIELSDGLSSVSLGPDVAGFCVLLRLDGAPIHFALERRPGPATVTPEELIDAAGRPAALEVLRERIRKELTPSSAERRRVSLTVAVCTRDREEELAQCLQSLLTNGGEGRPLDVLVVDNGSKDDATRRVAESLGARYVREPLPGLDFARNRALRETEAEFVAFVDDDVRVDRGWLDALATALSEQPDAAVVTGLVLPLELETDAQILFEEYGGFRRGFQKIRFAGAYLPGAPFYPVAAGSFGAGCNMIVRRSAILGLGGFDEALDTGPPLPGGGDLDIFYRVARAGMPIAYEPRMIAYHRHRRTRTALRRQYWTWGTGLMAFISKSYRSNADDRPAIRQLIRWWMVDGSRRLLGSIRRRGPLPPDLVAAELVGGLVGLGGAYGRSVRRTVRLRRQRG